MKVRSDKNVWHISGCSDLVGNKVKLTKGESQPRRYSVYKVGLTGKICRGQERGAVNLLDGVPVLEPSDRDDLE